MAVTIDRLARAELDEARAVLAAACVFDRAAEVADEKLFAAAPAGEAIAWGARDAGALLGVAAVTADRLRLLAVTPGARGRGVGAALLEHAEAHARAAGAPRLRTLDLPGNYLAPGIDMRNVDTLGWLERRGWLRHGENVNLIVALHGNPQVSRARADETAAAARARGYQIRRAVRDEPGLREAIVADFGGAWPHEVARALDHDPAGVHVAIAPDGSIASFAAHDGNNQGLGWFGPAGTHPAHRGQRLAEALLLACLVDIAVHHARCEVAWIGPRRFYEHAAGVIADRHFLVLQKDLT